MLKKLFKLNPILVWLIYETYSIVIPQPYGLYIITFRGL